MTVKPLTTDAIALTEKKMDMSLDDIIKMSKNDSLKHRNGKQGVSNSSQKFYNNVAADKSAKFKRFTETRSSLRQENLAQRRTSFHDNHFPLTAQAARKAAVAPIHNRGFSRSRAVSMNVQRVAAPLAHRNFSSKDDVFVKQKYPQDKVKPVTRQKKLQTLDSMFASMKEQRMKKLSKNWVNAPRRNGGRQTILPPPWARGGRFVQ
ncbi:unnamed protein product [Cuscuta epithymum]|uniref:Uncharacterized protein n=1 Tax=Cuscuta epithymum TaxID=186058 RepID=A0AAV0G0A3_9ASTE|nr:unnamed protein product [Cuscuta epithymum]